MKVIMFFVVVVILLFACLAFSWIDVHGQEIDPLCPDTPTPTRTEPPPTATEQPPTATPTETVIPPTDTVIPPPPTETATPALPGGTPKAMYPPGNPHSTPGLIPPVAVTFTPTATPDGNTPWNEKTPVVLPVTGYEPKDNDWLLYIVGGGLVVFGLLLFAVGKMRGGSDDQG